MVTICLWLFTPKVKSFTILILQFQMWLSKFSLVPKLLLIDYKDVLLRKFSVLKVFTSLMHKRPRERWISFSDQWLWQALQRQNAQRPQLVYPFWSLSINYLDLQLLYIIPRQNTWQKEHFPIKHVSSKILHEISFPQFTGQYIEVVLSGNCWCHPWVINFLVIPSFFAKLMPLRLVMASLIFVGWFFNTKTYK